SARLGCARHGLDRQQRIVEMMDDADTETNVEGVLLFQIIQTLPADLNLGERLEVAPGSRERAFVEIDRQSAARAIAHSPEAVAAGAASGIKKALPEPVLRRVEATRPATKLLFLARRQLIECIPRIVKTIR